MKLNRKVEYALMALNYMHTKKPGELTSAKELVAQFSISFDLISRVLQKLAAQKILRSVQGAHGGYQIIRDLREVSFYELNSMLTEPLGLAPCMIQDGKTCEIMSTCNIKTPIQKLNERLKSFYQQLSLTELLSGGVDCGSELDAGLESGLDKAFGDEAGSPQKKNQKLNEKMTEKLNEKHTDTKVVNS